MKLQPRIPLLVLMAALAVMGMVSCSDTDDDDILRQSSVKNDNRNDTSKEPALARLEFPKVKGGTSRVVIHSLSDEFGINYSVEWDTNKKSQRWSCYQQYKANSVNRTSRYTSTTNQYPFDPDLPSGLYFNGDPFWGSGYDHGHICPSADRLYSKEANMQTFYLTNMQPQRNAFNANLWADMESFVRSRANSQQCDTLYICKGGTIDKADQVMLTLANGLLVPKYFYMALLMKNSAGYKAMAFWVEHTNQNLKGDDLGKYVVSVRELEQLTDIDFFCNLPDDVEERVETLAVENIKRAWGL